MQTIVLSFRGRGRVWLSVLGGTVIAAMGCEPKWYVGKNINSVLNRKHCKVVHIGAVPPCV